MLHINSNPDVETSHLESYDLTDGAERDREKMTAYRFLGCLKAPFDSLELPWVVMFL